jgi:hypothetical protein
MTGMRSRARRSCSSAPGLGPFVAAGPIMAALGGAAAGAAAGGLTGALVGLGMPEYEAKRYEGKIKSGGLLISIHTERGPKDYVLKGSKSSCVLLSASCTLPDSADHPLLHPKGVCIAKRGRLHSVAAPSQLSVCAAARVATVN